MKLSTGSGFFISSDGLMVTCHHVIEDGEPMGVVLNDGRQFTICEVMIDDEDADLAVIRVDGSGFRCLHPATTKLVTVGQSLRVVSRFGVCAATVRERPEDDEVLGEFILSAPSLRKGASGGAVLDADGSVVAVIVGAVNDDPGQVVAVQPDWKALMQAENDE